MLPFSKFLDGLSFLYLVDESGGNFGQPGCEQLYVQIFAKDMCDIPPMKLVGDFIYLYDVAVIEYNGRYQIP